MGKRSEEPAGAEKESSPMLEMHLDDTEPAGVPVAPKVYFLEVVVTSYF